MNRLASFSLLSLATASICLMAGIPHSALAQATPAEGTVDLIATPPQLTAKVAPNVVLTFDDSGSMASAYMPDQRPYDGSSWSSSARWYCAGVIDPTAAEGSLKARPMNGMYYNPNTVYKPPLYADGTSFPNSSYTSAWTEGIQHNRPGGTNSSKTNLSSTKFCDRTTNGGGYYRYTGPALSANADGKFTSASQTNLYTKSNWTWVALPSSQQTNFANWYSYYRYRKIAAISGTSHAFASFDKSVRIAWQNINAATKVNPGTTVLAPFEGTTRTNFYDWLFKNPASGGTPNQAAAGLVGELFMYGENVENDTNPYWDSETGRELSCRKNFHIQMTDGMWNGGSITTKDEDNNNSNDNAPLPRTLPDGRSYAKGTLGGPTTIYWNETSPSSRSMADIGFHYWATDLRPDFQSDSQKRLKVRPYLADPTTGLTDTQPLAPGQNWRDNPEIYWNPANNPATWPHLVQYMIGFGVDGTIPATDENLEKLRTGDLKWPKIPSGNTAEKIDDMWHAAVNSRGQFFAAANPDELIDAIQKIIASVVAQSTSSTPVASSLPILTGASNNYQGGYDSSGWIGSVRAYPVSNAGMASWDAGCLLTGGTCTDPAGSGTPRDPNSRIIVTSNDGSGGKAFTWSSLTSQQQTALNAGGSHGALRVDYLRGKRDNEAASAIPKFRYRTSVLGAVINAELTYVSAPRSGYRDRFPDGSPEALAAAANEINSYAGYQNAQRARAPMLYVGASDGMMHAFDATTGEEKWAFVPNTLIRNGRMTKMTDPASDLVPGVDSTPLERDVFINGKWRTVLVGSLGLGGRGVYALDVTKPTFATESDAAGSNGVVLWEFSNGDTQSTAGDLPCAKGSRTCASLGYTYNSANIARLRYQDKWVAVVSSGYFPESKTEAAKVQDITEAAASRTSLLVIDLETGELIREIRTEDAPQDRPDGFKTFGLSTPMVYDLGSDEIDDIVYAGDLAGNLWRFDLSDGSNFNNWKVDLMFSNYGEGGASEAGDQPIVFNPTALRDPTTRRPILVVGTGKYLGEEDRTASNAATQAWYGIRDYGTDADAYPIRVNQLFSNKIVQGADDAREIKGYSNPTASLGTDVPLMHVKTYDSDGDLASTSVRAHGWRILLDISTEIGERAQRRAVPLVTGNVALLYDLTPKSDDPCDPGARYAIMAIDGATGSPLPGSSMVGVALKSPTVPPDPVVKPGGEISIGGTGPSGGGNACDPDDENCDDDDDDDTALEELIKPALQKASTPWHRGAWRELLDW